MPRSVLPPPTPEPQPSRLWSVLIAEDEPSIARILTRQFSRAGIRVVSAVDTGATVQVVDQDLADISLVFVDFHDTGQETHDFCLWIRTIRPELPVLLATGRNQVVGMVGGPTYLLPRPYRPAEVVGSVRYLLSRQAV